MKRCSHNNNTVNKLLTKSKGIDLEARFAPVGSGMNLAQALALVSDGNYPSDTEVWVRSWDSETLSPQMSAIVVLGSLIDELGSAWHLACLACNAAELEVELWG